MTLSQKNNPLQGLTLETILTRLVSHLGWHRLGTTIPINCFTKTPSIKSSLKFLRRTSWAREKVENLYLQTSFPKEMIASGPEKKPAHPPEKRAKKRIYLMKKADK